jgi:NCAIR mutase (PurE)-related protein
MTEPLLRSLLRDVQAGRASVDETLRRLRTLPYEDLGFAKVDHHRAIRCGFPEVIFCEGKTPSQIAEIFDRSASHGDCVLATRATPAAYAAVIARRPAAKFHEPARCITLGRFRPPDARPGIAIVAAGTADMPVAEEARVTVEAMNRRAVTFYDVGVAGIHRLLAHTGALQSVNVVIAVAGMEGALPSVVGGLVACPVIAVPTSVGYGTGAGGLAALLSMLNSCASNVTVVNIDNGFGAGYTAALVDRRCSTSAGESETVAVHVETHELPMSPAGTA